MMLSRKCNRPVKLVMNRNEVFRATGPTSGSLMTVRLGAMNDGKIVAAICHGGWLLVSANILKGRKATSFFAIKDDLIAAGADYTDEEVVVDGNIITSRKPEDLPAFVVEIIKQLKGTENE